jgi:hypothetical protein
MTTKDFISIVEDEMINFDVFENGISEVIQVWYCKTIQNHKGLFIVKDKDGCIYPYFIEATYNGDEKELYLDMYSKYTKQTIDLKWDEVYL